MWIEFHKNGVRLSRYTYRCVALPDADDMITVTFLLPSQCTYRCVVLPDRKDVHQRHLGSEVSMHLQVRGAP